MTTVRTTITVPAHVLPEILAGLNTRIGLHTRTAVPTARALILQRDTILAELMRAWPAADELVSVRVADRAAQEMLYILQDMPDKTIGPHQETMDAAIETVSAIVPDDVDSPTRGI